MWTRILSASAIGILALSASASEASNAPYNPGHHDSVFSYSGPSNPFVNTFDKHDGGKPGTGPQFSFLSFGNFGFKGYRCDPSNVPLPAALPMFLGGLAALKLAARRKASNV